MDSLRRVLLCRSIRGARRCCSVILGRSHSDSRFQPRQTPFELIELHLELRDALELNALVLEDLLLIVKQLVQHSTALIQEVDEAIVFFTLDADLPTFGDRRHPPSRRPIRVRSHEREPSLYPVAARTRKELRLTVDGIRPPTIQIGRGARGPAVCSRSLLKNASSAAVAMRTRRVESMMSA